MPGYALDSTVALEMLCGGAVLSGEPAAWPASISGTSHGEMLFLFAIARSRAGTAQALRRTAKRPTAISLIGSPAQAHKGQEVPLVTLWPARPTNATRALESVYARQLKSAQVESQAQSYLLLPLNRWLNTGSASRYNRGSSVLQAAILAGPQPAGCLPRTPPANGGRMR